MKSYSERMHRAAKWLVAYNAALAEGGAVRVIGRVSVFRGPGQ